MVEKFPTVLEKNVTSPEGVFLLTLYTAVHAHTVLQTSHLIWGPGNGSTMVTNVVVAVVGVLVVIRFSMH